MLDMQNPKYFDGGIRRGKFNRRSSTMRKINTQFWNYMLADSLFYLCNSIWPIDVYSRVQQQNVLHLKLF